MRKVLYILTILAFFSCSEYTDELQLTESQKELIGKGVNFDATKGSEFNHQTRASYIDTGVFNEDDLMRIYRQYALDGGAWGNEAYRTYYFHTQYATGTIIDLGRDWRVYKDRMGKNPGDAAEFKQGEADSITWENGKTVRFRSWTRNNYANAVTSCYKYKDSGITNYYPDFSISDWVTVSGPTEQVPLTMRHICSRIAFSYRNNGSQFYKVEIATNLEDYKRKDNADTSANDNSNTEANKTNEKAQEELDAVMDAYNRMCMPAGVDIEKSELYAMTKAFWEPLDNNDADNKKLRFLENEPASTFYHFGDDTPANVEKNVQRPVFANVNTSCYLITIPYDMSNGDQQGNIITLPACTRFRVYLRDVNNGDGYNTGGYEGAYHIFSLQDIVDESTKEPLFPNGLEMAPGFSYKFNVGYRYNQLTITANDNFSWDAQDAEKDNLQNADNPQPETSPADYTWWKNTIKNAIPKDGGDFKPEFTISNEKEFIEFMNLINNTAAVKKEGLYRAKRKDINPDHKDNAYDRYFWWYTNVSDNKRDTTWVTSTEATALGYLLYESYHAANGTQPAYSQEEYIRGAYPFYDETRDVHYTVKLNADLDLGDWCLPSIGNSEGTPFKGFFDGQMHKLSNVYMEEEYLFKYIDAAAIGNLKIESTHKVSLVKEGKNTCYIVGIDLRAHSTMNSIAEKLTTNEYNNASYVIGCIHVGDAGGALVGKSGNLYMQGCMQAAEGIDPNTGALLGDYLDYSSPYAKPEDRNTWQFFTPQISFDFTDMNATYSGKVSWGRFMCNYYDTQLSPNTNAVKNIKDKYSPLEYIRGRETYILKAKNDNLLGGDVTFSALNTVSRRYAYYGLAPWKAMNYAIYKYNQTSAAKDHKCTAHYENNSTGYVHKYPELLPGVPSEEQYADPLKQKN